MQLPKLAAALLTLTLAAHAGAVEVTSRGIHRFTSDSGCPIGARDDELAMMCNRIALDDNFVRVDHYPKQRSIQFSNLRGADAKKRIAGDVVLHGVAKAQNGQTVPVSLLVKVTVANDRWSAEAQAHTTVEGKLRDVRIDLYHITAQEAGATKVLFTPEQALKALAAPSLSAQQAPPGVQLRDSRTRQTATAGSKQADVTVVLGTQAALRARLDVKGKTTPDTLPDTLLRGDWALELQALNDQVPLDVLQRELFLTGLEIEPLLKPLRLKGFKKGVTFTFGVQGLRGFVKFDGQEVEFDRAARAGQVFLQDSFVGLALIGQITRP